METEHFAVIYNLSPILPGHCLIISKDHQQSMFEFSNRELSEMVILSRKLAKFLGEVFDTSAFNWAIQEREAAGQSVAHFHMHVVPRTIGDLEHPGAWYSALERSEELPIDSSDRFRLTRPQLTELTQRLKKRAKFFFSDDDTVN
jgi:bis(5'-adenosyl)-triphosphatase